MTFTPYAVAYRPDVADETLGMVPFPMREQPFWRALMGGVGDSLQRFEDDAFAAMDAGYLDTAAGVWLDRWGLIVGEERGALEDRDYRRFIRARALCNRFDGTVESSLAIWRTVMDVDDMHGWEVENYPAAFYLVAVRDTLLTDIAYRRVYRTMQDARPGCVTLTMIEALDSYHGGAGSRYSIPPTASLSRLIHEAGP